MFERHVKLMALHYVDFTEDLGWASKANPIEEGLWCLCYTKDSEYSTKPTKEAMGHRMTREKLPTNTLVFPGLIPASLSPTSSRKQKLAMNWLFNRTWSVCLKSSQRMLQTQSLNSLRWKELPSKLLGHAALQ